ncbi:MAG: DNA methyltransferase [Acetobacteraceae bacterium]|nr:DNA methyltransferase [Acetobacteraceae bacterium]
MPDGLTQALPLIAAMPPLTGDFAEMLRRFSFDGTPTEEFEADGLRYFVNAFWTAQQRRGHSLHEVSYRACFKPQLPEFFIARLTAPGDTVYDPFAGRGTTPVQAALMGRRPVANDVNPLSAMLVAPRLDPPSLAAIRARLAEIGPQSAVQDPDEPDLSVFYHPDTLRQIRTLRGWLLARAAAGRLDSVDGWIRMVAINRLTGHSPGFFSVYTMPPNQAVSIESQRKINAQRQQTPPPRDVAALILKKGRALLADGCPPPHPPASLTTGPADGASGPADASVDLLVTSPPFLDIVDYQGDNWLRCWFAGIDPATVRIDRHRDVAAWEAFVRRSFIRFAQAVRPGGFVAFEVGEVRGGSVLLERHVAAAVIGLPFAVLGVMVNRQDFTKTANCWGVGNNRGGTNTNRIVLLQRNG